MRRAPWTAKYWPTKGTDVPGLRMPALKDAGWRQMRRTKDDGGTLVSNIDLFGSLWGPTISYQETAGTAVVTKRASDYERI